jgi:pimeloyl-ACP methyl ester carboxylesterase
MDPIFSTISTLLFYVATCIAVVCLLSFTILWYETANRHPDLMIGRFTPSRLWFTSKLILGEFIALCCNLFLLPFGLFPPREKLGGAGTPVLLLHGLFHNRAIWALIRFRLRLSGITDLHTINLPAWKDIEVLTERVANRVDELRQSRGIDRVHLVGHSMGGVIARNYLQIRGGAKKIDRCVLLGTPNAGSKMVPFAVTGLARNLIPGSAFLCTLNTRSFPEGTRVTNIFSRHDNLVLPAESARLAGRTNIELSGIGHNALLYHPRAFRALLQALTDADD